jgi:hypothetical protein
MIDVIMDCLVVIWFHSFEAFDPRVDDPIKLERVFVLFDFLVKTIQHFILCFVFVFMLLFLRQKGVFASIFFVFSCYNLISVFINIGSDEVSEQKGKFSVPALIESIFSVIKCIHYFE